MNIRRFFGKNSRDALSMVRIALGEDAVILSNRAVNVGNEIMAFSEEDMDSMISSTDTGFYTPHEFARPPEIIRTNDLNNALNHEVENRPSKMINTLNSQKANDEDLIFDNVNHHQARPAIKSSQGEQEPNAQIADMLGEIRTMRNMIESQLTEISWNNIQQRDPAKSIVLSSLLSAGFSASLSRQIAENLPKNLNGDEGIKWMQSILSKNLTTVQTEGEVLDKGGVFALIGPTGVGKTTTTAKLAARYVMKHGTNNLGLITTDAYRIGGHEQLRIYGKILGVMVHAVKDEADLKIALNELKNKHTILIDTVGVSQRDRMVAEQISMLTNANRNIKKLLCLNATNTGETLVDVVNAYKGRGLDGCIITKLDEAATIGNTIDVIIRERLKLYYVANGQRVPEDIHLANKDYLIRQALKLGASKNSPFKFRDEELPFVMGNTVNSTQSPSFVEMSHA